MASNIVPGNVDGTFPKAGQDNSSQGFRDNFNATKNNFTEAKTEIEALQTDKANLDGSSNFADNEITRAKFNIIVFLKNDSQYKSFFQSHCEDELLIKS